MDKDRYELFGEHCIKDNDVNARCQSLDAYKVCVILNEQNKLIKSTKAQNERVKEKLGTITNYNQDLEKENQQLKEQLSNKEEILKRIMSGEYIPANIAQKSLELSQQAQNQTAISELEKVKNNLTRHSGAICNEDGTIKSYNYVIIGNDFEKQIDNQIKSLKGENNENIMC